VADIKYKGEVSLNLRQVDLKALRKKADLSQQVVADKAGISRSYYAMLENDRIKKIHNPTVVVLERLADVLDFTWTDYYKNVD